MEDLVAFLASLIGPQYKNLGDQECARQLALSKVSRRQRDTARAFGPKPLQPPPSPFCVRPLRCAACFGRGLSLEEAEEAILLVVRLKQAEPRSAQAQF
jgi:hypothetical protein